MRRKCDIMFLLTLSNIVTWFTSVKMRHCRGNGNLIILWERRDVNPLKAGCWLYSFSRDISASVSCRSAGQRSRVSSSEHRRLSRRVDHRARVSWTRREGGAPSSGVRTRGRVFVLKRGRRSWATQLKRISQRDKKSDYIKVFIQMCSTRVVTSFISE